MTLALSTIGLSVRFGGVSALDDVSLDVPASGLTGLIGPNGAGKSTLIDAVTGFIREHTTGRVLLGNHDVTRLSANRRAHLGLGRSWQSQELFEDVTVSENLAIAARRLTFGGALREMFKRPEPDPRVEGTLALLELTPVAGRQPRDLTQRERNLVGVARAIVGNPRLALLDEPAAGLDRYETDWLGERLQSVAASGIPILLVDHDMSMVLRISDRIHVLDRGRLLASGPPNQIRSDDRVIRAYLGSTAGEGT